MGTACRPYESFSQSFAWNDLGQPASVDCPRCLHAGCSGRDAARSVPLTYESGYLKSVGGWASSITYHWNGLPYYVTHQNGVQWKEDRRPDGMPMPYQITTIGGIPSGSNYSSGVYAFDGAGDIKSIGSDHFLYDKVGRLTESTAAQFAPGITKQYAYDPFGNLVTTTTKQSGHADEVFSTPVSGKTNHLSGASYDAAGNQLGWITRSMKYDAFGQVVQLLDTYMNQAYIYTAEGERLATYDAMTNRTSWKIRDLGGRVLREFLNAPVNGVANWSWKEDWIWRGSVLLGAATLQGNRHFDVDHLGSVRLITDDAKNVLSRHQYWAYGEEATSGSQDSEVMKFAGQERDFGTYYPDGIDYMHARYYDDRLSRFTTMDPLGGSPGAPQSWNRYGYVLGSPVTLVDPYGWAPAPGQLFARGEDDPEEPLNPFEPNWNPWDRPEQLILRPGRRFLNLENPVTDMTVREHWTAGFHGLEAFVDGVIPFADPIEQSGGYDGSDSGMVAAQWSGVPTQQVLSLVIGGQLIRVLQLGKASVLFRPLGGYLNDNNVLRVGWGYQNVRNGGYEVFRIVIGQKKPLENVILQALRHIDFW